MVTNNQKYPLKLIAAASLILVIFLILAYTVLSGSFFGSEKKRTLPPENPHGPGFSSDISKGDVDKSSLVQQLVDKTPYDGANFSFYYSFEDDEFLLYVDPQNPAAGNTEFNKFLNDNGVENRTWIENLTVVSVKPTPEP